MYKLLITYFFIFSPLIIFSQETEKQFRNFDEQESDTVFYEILSADTLQIDSLIVLDSLAIDSALAPVIEAPIDYNAEDSIIVSLDGQKVYMYNNAHVTYQEIELSAYFIELDLETKEVYAEGLLDSTETLIQKPIFNDGTQEFESKNLRYNFETEKGIITDVVTEQGEGYVHSERTKKISKDAFIMVRGKYTTCDAEHPHFYLHLSKAKVISNNKIITGPAYMVLEDFPIYFPFIPFGYFPNSPTYSSGILVPTYGEENNRGFFLRDGGYYWAAGEYFDLALRGDIYSRGSWSSKLHTNYRKRYKFSGSFDFKYALNVYGERGLDTYQKSPQFAVTWSHSQDAKANPNQTFSASVNFSTSGFDKQNSLSAQNYLRTQKSSSVSFTKKFENTPFNMSVNLRHSQNSTDTTITLSLPEMTFSMAKIYPLRNKKRSGAAKWYEKFGINYTGNLRNSITSKESELLQKSLADDWKNGIRHSIPISLPNFNLMKFINVSPSFSYNEKWYFKKFDRSFHANEIFYDDRGTASNIKVDTITGLNRVFDYSYSLSASTNIYGMFMPLNADSKIKGIRHKMTPSFSFSYRPDFGDPRFGYWQAVQVDTTGRIDYFDVNAGGIYGGSPGRGASGAISFSVNNNLEMKMLDTKDTTKTDEEQKFRKVKIIDNLSFGSSYNLIADSLNLAPISLRARTTIAGVSINTGGVLDPYMTDENGIKIHKYVWNEKSGLAKLGRLTRANLSFGMNFKSKKGEKEAEKNKELVEEENVLPGDYSDYADFNIPWDFGFDYSFNYTGPRAEGEQGKISQTLGFRGNLNLTSKWRISMNTNFDIVAREFSFTTFNVNRDLHCWQMAFNFVPFGYMKSYSFTINAKSSMLKDLKLSKRQSHYDNF
ncbi:MAG: LPS-assembly protein LptD [Prolixibacteraceae bacterium]|nr:LPS-assembly protein LptD [Prolixibacteraceae bacterium]MBT6763120.1 LPS-assembly protein LptD [Prolixibacteraceae bacterium]MBT6998839.1 LPS-assembly protein LptD [Prolixibacteraceae bacterium]MBT7395854.1 LPS-assembly protein LptD [Prolixibacteraceae bacterium]